MLKKIILFISILILTACSSSQISKTDWKSKKEQIKLVISSPNKDIILLGDNYDYQFTGEEARKLLTLIDFQQMKGLTKENLSQVKRSLTVDEKGNVQLQVSTDFKIYKKSKLNTNNKNFEKEQENFVDDLKKKLKEKDIEFQIKENNDSWDFYLPNTINVRGKVVKIENHDEILQKSSKQLLNLDIELKVSYTETPEFTNTAVGEVIVDTATSIVQGAAIVILAPIVVPFIAIYTILTLPVWLIATSH